METVESLKQQIDIIEHVQRTTGVELRQVGSTHRCLCPFHKDTNPSFHAYRTTNSFYCYGCGAAGSVIDFEMAFSKCSFSEAVSNLSQQYDIPIKWNREDQRLLQEKNMVENLLTKAAHFFHQEFSKRRKLLKTLQAQTGYSSKIIEELKIGFAPNDLRPLEYLQSQKKPDGSQYSKEEILKTGLFNYYHQKLTPFFKNRLVTPYWKGRRAVYFIGRRVKGLTPDIPTEKAKYKKLQTRSKDTPWVSDAIKNDYFFNEDVVHGATELILTEGVSDCVLAMDKGFRIISPCTTKLKRQDLDRLRKLVRNIPKIYVINDSEESGRGLEGALDTAKYLHSLGKEVRIVQIPREKGVQKVDLNDYLKSRTAEELRELMGRTPDYVEYLISQVPEDTPKQNLPNLLAPVISSLAQKDPATAYGYLYYPLKNRFKMNNTEVKLIERLVLDERERNAKQSAGQLDSHNDTDAKPLRDQIASKLEERYEIIGHSVKAGSRGVELTLWSRQRRSFLQVNLASPSSMKAAIAPDVGDYSDWVEREIGTPNEIRLVGDRPRPLPQRRKLVLENVEAAFLNLARKSKFTERLKPVSWGIHCPGDYILIVNGRVAFYRDFNENTWQEVHSPIFREHLIAWDDSRCWSCVTTTKDLEPNHPPKELLNLFIDVISEGWRFEDEVDPLLLSGITLLGPILKAFPREPLICLTQKNTSGKSRFVKGWLAGNAYMPGAVENACLETDISGAGLVAKYKSTSALLCFDDFEGDSAKEKRMGEVWGILRSSMDGETGRTRGTPSLGYRDLYVKSGAVFAGIKGFEQDQDLSRLVIIEMHHVKDLPPPEVTVRRLLREKGYSWGEVRRSVTTGLLAYIPQLREEYENIKVEVISGQEKLDSRFKEGILPILSMMKVLGLDYRSVAERIFQAKERHFRMTKATDEEVALVETLLYSPFELQNPWDPRKTTTLRLLLGDGREDCRYPQLGFVYKANTGELFLKLEAVRKVTLLGTQFKDLHTRGLVTLLRRSEYFARKKSKERVEGQVGNWTVLNGTRIIKDFPSEPQSGEDKG